MNRIIIKTTGNVMSIYVVKAGDTIDLIAGSTGVDEQKIIYDNQLVYPFELAVGQALLVDDNNDVKDRRSLYVNGFAYPFISGWVLRQTLPYLSAISSFSYGFNERGELIEPLLEDNYIIEEALKYGVSPILTLTPFGEDGRFNNSLISVVVNDAATNATLIDNLIDKMYEKGFKGVNIDFEYILKEDRDAFTDFVATTAERMRAEGFELSVDLAPKNSSTQQGLLYEGKDYAALGRVADHVLVMTYEWGYTYGPPMAVAPINQVRKVIEYAVTQIDSDKIDLGIPNYGYDWPLPYERGKTKAKTIGNVEAVRIAIDNGAQIMFDETAMSPYFTYTDSEGTLHEVWFEDVRSMSAKFNLIKEFNLRGAGYWQLMQLFRANWVLLNHEFDIIS